MNHLHRLPGSRWASGDRFTRRKYGSTKAFPNGNLGRQASRRRITVMENHFRVLVLCFAGLLFCAFNLCNGLRDKKVWSPTLFEHYSKGTSPWNYRVAMFGWVFSSLAALAGIIEALWRLCQDAYGN